MDVQKNTAYVPLRDEEKFTDSRSSSPSRIYRRLIIYLSISLVAAALSFTIYRSVVVPPIIDQCGTTPAEAKAKGCIFEVTGFSWLPKECTDPTIETEFLNSQKLQYYRDMNYTQEVSLDEVRKGDGPGFYVKQDYHLAHCALLFKKLHRAINTGHKIDGMISPVHHTSHCVHMLLGPPNNRWDAIQFAFVKYPYCGRDGGYNVEWEKQGEWTE